MDTNKLIEKWDSNFKKMVEKDAKAKSEGKLVGRFIKEPYADGSSYYQVIRENKDSVRIRVVTDIGDDWVLPYFGEETTVKKAYALGNIGMRDEMAALFKKNRA